MSTWGPSKKRSTSKRSTSASSKGATASSKGAKATSSSTGSGKGSSRQAAKGATAKGATAKRAKAGSVDDLTPPGGSGSRRDQAQAEIREAVGGRENEFVGLGLVGLAILLALAVYVNLAGPLG